MDNLVSVSTIIEWFKEQVINKSVIPPSLFLDASMKLNVLIGDEQIKYQELFQQVADLMKLRIESGDSVAKAKVWVNATEEYKKMKIQEAKIEQIEEFIRLGKIRSKMAMDELRSN